MNSWNGGPFIGSYVGDSYLRISIAVKKTLISFNFRYWRVRHRIKTRESLKRRPRGRLLKRERGRRPRPRRESTSDETCSYFRPRKESINGCTCIQIILFLPKKRKSKRLFQAVYYSHQFLLFSTTMWCRKQQELTSPLQVLYLYELKNVNV